MSALSEKRKGELFVALAGLFWAFFPVITVLSYPFLPSLHSLAWSTLFSVMTFAAVITYRKHWQEMKDPLVWRYGLYIAFFIGVLFYGLYFVGLESTSPGNAAIIVLFEIFTTFVFFNVFRGEKISVEYVFGAGLMIVGALIVLHGDFSHFNPGDLLILVATVFAPLGNFYQQKARLLASSETIMFMRRVLSAPFLFVLAYSLYPTVQPANIYAALPFLLINGLFLLGLSKLFWIESIHRVSVSKAMSLQSIAPFLTLIIAWVMLSQAPTLSQFASLIPFIAGALLLTDQIRLHKGE